MPSFEITTNQIRNRWRRHTGGLVLDLLFEQPRWVYRRIEHLCFDDDRTVRRRTECDITLEQVGTRSAPRIAGHRVLLPIAMHPRWPARHVIVVDARTNEPLPFLTRREERQMVAAGLTDWSYDLLGPAGTGFEKVPPDIRYRRLLSLIEPDFASPPADEEWTTGAGAELLQDFTAAMEVYWRDLTSNRIVVAMPEADHVAPGPVGRRRPNRFRLIEEHAEEFVREERPWARDTSFDVPHAKDWGSQTSTVWTIYDDDHHRHTDRPDGHFRPWNRPLKIDDVLVTIPASQVAECESYHFAFTAPPGVYIDYGRLLVTRFSVEDKDPPAEIIEIADDDPHWDVAHFWFTSSIGQLQRAEVVESSVVLVFRPMYHGVMRSGLATAWLTAALLGLLTFTAGWGGTGWDPLVHVPMVDRDTNSVVSLLLIVPTIVLAVLIRQDEHVFTKYVLNAYRIRLGVLATITFFVGVLFAVGFSGVQMFLVLAVATALAFGLALSLHTAAAYSRSRLRQTTGAG